MNKYFILPLLLFANNLQATTEVPSKKLTIQSILAKVQKTKEKNPKAVKIYLLSSAILLTYVVIKNLKN